MHLSISLDSFSSTLTDIAVLSTISIWVACTGVLLVAVLTVGVAAGAVVAVVAEVKVAAELVALVLAVDVFGVDGDDSGGASG